jgi:hypothetical protein
VLERRLNDPPPAGVTGVEVINLGVSGYDTRQEVEFLRVKGLEFDFDLVLVAYCLNDTEESSEELDDFRRDEGWEVLGLRGTELAGLAVMRSHFVRAVWYRAKLWRGTSGEARGASEGLRDEGFDELHALAGGHGFDVAVAIFPNLYSFAPYQYWSEHEAARASAEHRGFEVTDLLPALYRAADGRVERVRAPCTSVHPNAFGHEIVAEELEHFVRRRVPR